MKKAVFITNVPAPYRVAMLNHAVAMLAQAEIELVVVFAAAGYRRRAYWRDNLKKVRFPYRMLDDPSLEIGEKLFNFSFSLPRVLNREKADLLVLPAFSIPSQLAYLHIFRRKIPFLIYSGETPVQAARRRLEWFRIRARRFFLSRCAGCIAYGTESRQFLMDYGVPEERVFVAINSIDTEAFMAAQASRKPKPRDESAPPRMLYVGNLQKLKGLDLALKALHRAGQSGPEIAFDIVGGGPDESRLKHLVQELRLERVVFWGAKPYEEIPDFYAAADFLIFPSLYDIFGLVMVEAAAMGLPIIASSRAGGTVDVVRDGWNGYSVDPEDTEHLAECIADLRDHPEKRGIMGAHSRQIIAERVNIQKSAEGFCRAISQTLERTRATYAG